MTWGSEYPQQAADEKVFWMPVGVLVASASAVVRRPHVRLPPPLPPSSPSCPFRFVQACGGGESAGRIDIETSAERIGVEAPKETAVPSFC
jgi:hypothetical protein